MIILLSRLLYRQKYNRTEKISFHEIEGINEQNGTYFETFIAIESKNITVISTLHNREMVEEYIGKEDIYIFLNFKIFSKKNWTNFSVIPILS